MRELHDVQAIPVEVTRHRGQMAEHVVERHQVAQRVEHRDREVETAGQAEVPHVGLHHGQLGPGRLRQLARPRAHRRAKVERGGHEPAARQVTSVRCRTSGELENRPRRAGIRRPVPTGPPQQRVHFGTKVTIGRCGLIELRLVIYSGHPTMMPDAIASTRPHRVAS